MRRLAFALLALLALAGCSSKPPLRYQSRELDPGCYLFEADPATNLTGSSDLRAFLAALSAFLEEHPELEVRKVEQVATDNVSTTDSSRPVTTKVMVFTRPKGGSEKQGAR